MCVQLFWISDYAVSHIQLAENKVSELYSILLKSHAIKNSAGKNKEILLHHGGKNTYTFFVHWCNQNTEELL